jgi:hypothetical protein
LIQTKLKHSGIKKCMVKYINQRKVKKVNNYKNI